MGRNRRNGARLAMDRAMIEQDLAEVEWHVTLGSITSSGKWKSLHG